MPLVGGVHQRGERSGRQQRSFDRVGWRSRDDHLLDAVNEAGKVRERPDWLKPQFSGNGLGEALESSSKDGLLDKTVQKINCTFQTARVFEQEQHGNFDEFARRPG